MSASGVKITIEIDTDKQYTIDEVVAITGYSSGYLRNLERDGSIPKAQRDAKDWRLWKGDDVVKILKYISDHKHTFKKK